ncbi:MAG: polysaccharide pyruvyl transferase family protein [Kiritimatiellae bacterium]|nr:polysaccharide pyruvyl transferase family protein [Kiritimatiellia bacterium]
MTDGSLKILLRSSWQTVNIGDIAHTPGILALLDRHLPQAAVTLWPNELSDAVHAMLLARFPRLRMADTPERQSAALAECDFFLHGSGPGLCGHKEAARARKAHKPYGFAGITLSDEELAKHRTILAESEFIFCRDTDSLAALEATGMAGPRTAFGPDATFALDLRDDAAAERLMAEHGLEPGKFLCVVPRLRYTPYWEIYTGRDRFVAEKDAINRQYAELDHAKLREAITEWVRQVQTRVFLVPEMTYVVSRLRALLFDGLPDDVKRHVAVIDRYWLTAEAASVYARAAAVLSMEMHSPIMALAAGTPAVLVRQPTDTRKGQMWRDIGLTEWIFEVDRSTGAQIADRIVALGRDPTHARAKAAVALAYAQARMQAMAEAVRQAVHRAKRVH